MSVNYIYTQINQKVPDNNDITILGNASGVTDQGRVIGEEYYSATVKYGASLTLNRNNARLTIGGDYAGNANISYLGHQMRENVTAVRFAQDGAVIFAAQTGAAGAVGNQDANLVVTARHEAYSEQNYWTNNAPITDNVSVSAFEAGGTLSVVGDIAGTISAVSDSRLLGLFQKSNDKYEAKNTSVNQAGNSVGLKARALAIGNGFTGIVRAETKTHIAGFASNDVTGNTFSASGIETTEGVTGGVGEWSGAIFANSSDSIFEASVARLNPSEQGDRSSDKATLSNNTIKASGISAGGTVKIDNMVAGMPGGSVIGEVNLNIGALVEGNVLSANVSKADADVNIAMSNNVLASVGIKAGTLELGRFGNDAMIAAQTSGNSMTTSFGSAPKKKSFSFTGNRISATGFEVTDLKAEDFYGTLQANLTGNQLQLAGWTDSIDADVEFRAYGINASGKIEASNNFAGTITVNSLDNIGHINQFKVHNSKIITYGIKANSVTVNGIIDTDISVYAHTNETWDVQSTFGISVDTLKADAFSGTLTVLGSRGTFGIYASNASGGISSNVAGDAFDINGDIISTRYGVFSYGKINLRISGSITAGVAIGVESTYDERTGIYATSTPNNPDQVELAAGAVINGDIDLGGGDNTVIINSGAVMNGSLVAELGSMNIMFMLDEKINPEAIVRTDVEDISLTSASTITVNLNNAVNNSSYVLFQYEEGSDSTVTSCWMSREVRFVYQGEEYEVRMTGGRAECVFSNGVRGVLTYDQSTRRVIATVSDMQAASAFTGTPQTLVNYQDRSITLFWLGAAKAEQFEIEYSINGGRSIVVKVDGSRSSYVIQGLDNSSNYNIVWKVRGSTGNGTTVSAWSTQQTTTFAPVLEKDDAVVTLTGNTPYVVNPSDAGAGITSAIAKFVWGNAVSTNTNGINTENYAIKNYTVRYFESDAELSDAEVLAYFKSGKPFFTKTVTGTEVTVSGLTNQRYVYWSVQATDVYGNSSELELGDSFRVWVGDNVKPYFPDLENNAEKAKVDCTFDRTDPYNVKLNVSFYWSEAQDSQSGVKQYVIEYKLKGTEWSTAERVSVLADRKNPSGGFAYSLSKVIAGGMYEYRITAVDNVGNQSDPVIEGEFGSEDLTPPEGKFISLGKAQITVTRSGGSTETPDEGGETETVSTVSTRAIGSGSSGLLDDQVTGGGNSGGNSGGSSGGDGGATTPTEPVNRITGATVTVSWEDTFTDPSGVKYIVQFSDDMSFTSNRTFEVTADGKSLVLGDGVGNAVGRLSGMSTVYWRVRAVDGAGNTGAFWSNISSFEFKDPETGEAIVDYDTPTAPSNLSVTQGEGRYVSFNWSGSSDQFGLSYYELQVTLNGETRTYRISSGDNTDMFGYEVKLWADGVCTWKVTAVDGTGKVASSSTEKLTVDTAAPNWDKFEGVIGLDVTPAQNNPIISWNPALDLGHEKDKDGGVKHYVLQYRIAGQGDDAWQSMVVEGTSQMLNLGNGSYEFRVSAVDHVGNQSEWSEVQEYLVTSGGDSGNTMGSATLIESGWSNKESDRTVGMSDPADYLKFRVDRAFELTISVSDVKSLYNNGSGITIKVLNSSGKVVGNYSVANGSKSFTMSLLAGMGQTFYIEVTSKKSNAIMNYELEVDYKELNANNADDTWTLAQNNAAYHCRVDAVSSEQGNKVSETLVETDWVGFGDTADYRKLVLSQAGNYSFTISNPGGANGGLANSVTLTIYKADGKSKLKSITVKPKYDARTGTWTATAGSTGYFLMEAGTYYVAVGAPGGNKGENTDYSVKVDGTVFNHAKNGIANNTIDQAKALAGVKLGGNADGTLTSTKVLEQEWVGYGDAVDYQKLVFQHAGSYTFTTSGLSGKVKLTVYSVDANGKQKSLKSITVNSGTGTIKDLLLEANTNYYIAVESTDAKKGASIDYEVSVGGKVFNHDKNGLANNSFDQARALPVLTVTGNADGTLGSTPVLADEWVGYGDAADWQKLTFTDAGSYTFTVSGLSQKAKLTVYSVDANGKLKSMKSITVNAPKSGVASGTIKDLLMLAGTTYYIAVEAPDWKKGVGTDYELNVSGNVFNHAKNNLANNSYDQVRGQSVTPITGNADGTLSTTPLLADEWVGYGDSVDFQKLTFTNAGSYTFTVSGVSQKVKLTVYSVDANGKLKSMKSITVNAPKSGVASGTIQNLLMEAGKDYYVAVEAPDWKKGVGTDYDLTVNGNVFNHAKNNLANNSYEQVKDQSVTPITGNADGTLSTTPLLADEWVGYGDSVDFQKITLANDGTYSFTVSGVSQKVKLTVYGVDAKGNLKSLKSITVNAPKSGVASGTIQNLLMDAGSYYVAVEATDWKKGVGTDYNVSMSGSVYNNAKNGLNNGSWNAAGVETLTLSTGKAVSGEWVGYGDASDYFVFKVGADGSAAGQYTFKLTSADGNNLNGNATFTIYQKKYNSKGAASVSKVGSFTNNKADSITLELGEGEYFMAVDSADKGKGKKNMGYDIDVTAPAAPSLTSFAQDQQPAPAAAFADLAGFDGVTAALNAVAADTLAGFGSALDSLSGGDEQKKNPLFSVL
ncbi:fibronectin type III domain-containing protein [Victivallis vadensis]|uniref:fibronectin type III domain-containing protein n=1 Tax=Victivallis vadensis TaxID=172901 RepID=UPI0023F9FE83|nr:fibronectin type III domain-containing protein [Victivallis vadensis]